MNKAKVSDWSVDRQVQWNDVPVLFHPFELELLQIAESLNGKSCKIAIYYPGTNLDIAIPFALQLILDANYYPAVKDSKRKKVFIVASQLAKGLRENYELVTNLGGNITHVFGSSSVGRTGKVKSHTGRDRKSYPKSYQKDSIIFSNSFRYLPTDEAAKEIAAVLCLSPSRYGYDNVKELLKWSVARNIPNFILFENKHSSFTIETAIKLNLKIYGWNPDEVALVAKRFLEKNPNFPNTPFSNFEDIAWIATRKEPSILTVRPSEFTSDIDLFLRWTTALKKARMDPQKKSIILAESYKVISLIQKLCSSLKDLDNEPDYYISPSLSDRIKNLITWGTDNLDAGGYEAFSVMKVYLEKLLKHLNEKKPPKFFEVKSLILSKSEGTKLAIIFPSSRHLKAFLKSLATEVPAISEDAVAQKNVFLYPASIDPDYLHKEKFDSVYFVSYPFPENLKMLSSYIGGKIFIVLYKPEERYFRLITEKINLFLNTYLIEDIRKKTRDEYVLNGKDFELPIPPAYAFQLENTGAAIQMQTKHGKPKTLLDLIKNYEMQFDNITQTHPSLSEDFDNMDQRMVEEAVKVNFHGGLSILGQKNSRIHIADQSGLIKYEKISKLSKGDLVIIVDGTLFADLNRLIIQKAADISKLRELSFLASSWADGLRAKTEEKGDSQEEVVKKLREKGSRIESAPTIWAWKQGFVIGPKDLQDIKRIGEIYNLDYISKNFNLVAGAVIKLRQLRRLVVRHIIDKALEDDMQEIEDFGIDLGEFESRISRYTVESVENVKHVKYSLLGKVM